MEKIFKIQLFVCCVLILNFVSAQTPQGFNFQAVLRSKTGVALSNKGINLRISITSDTTGNTLLYAEAHTKQTSVTGSVSVVVGNGFVLNGSFAAIDWTQGNRYLKVEFAETGQTQFDLFSITQLLSVPFALHAQTVEKETDPQFASSVAASIKATDTVRWNAKSSFSGKYTDLTSLPTFAKIATTGSYADLSNKPLFTSYDSHLANTIVHLTSTERTNWNTAFTWGDHSKVGYLKSFTETDPLFSSSLAAGIKATDTAKWNAKSTFSGKYSDLSGIPTLAKVASSGSYNDLGNKLTAGAGIAITVSNVISSTLVGLPTQTGNAGKVLTTNGTMASWASIPCPKNYIDGLTLSNNITTPATVIDISSGVCTDSTNTVSMIINNTMNITLGAPNINSWYHIYLIAKADGTLSATFSDASSKFTLPSGYLYKRRIGSVKTDNNGNLVSFLQQGDYFYYHAPITDIGTTSTTSRVLYNVSTPKGIVTTALLRVFQTGTGDGHYAYGLITSPNAQDIAPDSYNFHVLGFDAVGQNPTTGYLFVPVLTDTQSRVGYRCTDTFYFSVSTIGYIDLRGKQ